MQASKCSERSSDDTILSDTDDDDEVGATSMVTSIPLLVTHLRPQDWSIRARVTSKNAIKNYRNQKTEKDSVLFSVALLDSSGIDINATFFNQPAVDKFYNVLEKGKVYNFTNGKLKMGRKGFHNCQSNIEITFDENAEIHIDLAKSDDIKFEANINTGSCTKIIELKQLADKTKVDFIGKVIRVGNPYTVQATKNGENLQKCDLRVMDETDDVELVLWGTQTTNAFERFSSKPIILIRNGRINEYFATKSVSGGMVSELDKNSVEAKCIRKWWRSIPSNERLLPKKLPAITSRKNSSCEVTNSNISEKGNLTPQTHHIQATPFAAEQQISGTGGFLRDSDKQFFIQIGVDWVRYTPDDPLLGSMLPGAKTPFNVYWDERALSEIGIQRTPTDYASSTAMSTQENNVVEDVTPEVKSLCEIPIDSISIVTPVKNKINEKQADNTDAVCQNVPIRVSQRKRKATEKLG